MRILIVEDEPNLNSLLAKRLKQEHYAVDACLNGRDAWEYIINTEYDAIVLDIMIPFKNGLEILSDMRRMNNNTPVLLLTAMDSVDDRVRGLDHGADDYLVKPFSFDELTARIRAMLRRKKDAVADTLTVADLTIDRNSRTVTRGGTPISLSSKEYSILEYLMRNAGIVLSRDKIGSNVWSYDYEGGSNVVDVYIRYLRKKVDDNFPVKLIHTIRGTGYVIKEEK